MDPRGQCKFYNRPYLVLLTVAVQTGRVPESQRHPMIDLIGVSIESNQKLALTEYSIRVFPFSCSSTYFNDL